MSQTMSRPKKNQKYSAMQVMHLIMEGVVEEESDKSSEDSESDDCSTKRESGAQDNKDDNHHDKYEEHADKFDGNKQEHDSEQDYEHRKRDDNDALVNAVSECAQVDAGPDIMSILNEMVNEVEKTAGPNFLDSLESAELMDIGDSDSSYVPNESELDESDQSMEKTDQGLEKTDRSLEETDRAKEETDRGVKETDQVVEESGGGTEETDRDVDETDGTVEETNHCVEETDQSVERFQALAASNEDVPEYSQENDMPLLKRARKGEGKREEWCKVKNQKLRMRGEAYMGYRKTEQQKWVQDVNKSERKMGPRCSCKLKTCKEVTDDLRSEIFNQFWKEMSWDQKKTYVRSVVLVHPVKRRRESTGGQRRNMSLAYHIRRPEQDKLMKVCKNMFLSTHGLGEWTARSWVMCTSDSSADESEPEEASTSNNQVENPPPETEASDGANENPVTKTRANAQKFLDQLPKVPSHYCRASSTKKYLEPNWQSFAALHREYKNWCSQQTPAVQSLGYKTFVEEIHKRNIGIFQPRKDQCDKCCAHKCGNVPDEEYQLHLQMKNEARHEKQADKENPNLDVYTMDLQAVLLCPRLKASALYYKTKLCVHNFTMYHLTSKQVVNYVWHEGEGGLSASEFASIIVDFLDTKIKTGQQTPIVLYSDGCTYQNRNSTLANALLHVAKRTGVTIIQKYLEKGHTQMECDAVHSRVEHRLENRDIYVPTEYVTTIGDARITPFPYTTKYVHHGFFMDYSQLDYYKSIRPGTRVGDPTVTDLRCLKYDQDGICYKLRYNDEWSILPQRLQLTDHVTQSRKIKPLYAEPLKIKKEKFVHLQQIKYVMPADYHPFFNSLPHICDDVNVPCHHVI